MARMKMTRTKPSLSIEERTAIAFLSIGMESSPQELEHLWADLSEPEKEYALRHGRALLEYILPDEGTKALKLSGGG
jgi:hypothetical protein